MCTYEKETDLAQIPGLQYQMDPVFIEQKPITWSDENLNDKVLGIVKIRKLSETIITEANDEELKYAATQANPRWQEFKDYCQVKNITGLKGLRSAPE